MKLGACVWLKANTEHKGVIVGVITRLGGSVLYEVSWSNLETCYHYGAELTLEKLF